MILIFYNNFRKYSKRNPSCLNKTLFICTRGLNKNRYRKVITFIEFTKITQRSLYSWILNTIKDIY